MLIKNVSMFKQDENGFNAQLLYDFFSFLDAETRLNSFNFTTQIEIKTDVISKSNVYCSALILIEHLMSVKGPRKPGIIVAETCFPVCTGKQIKQNVSEKVLQHFSLSGNNVQAAMFPQQCFLDCAGFKGALSRLF